MLLQEGGKGRYHLGNLVQHMETAPVLVPVTATKSRIRCRIYSEPIHRLLGEGIFLPTYLV